MGSLVIWVIHICWLASGPGGERFQWNSLTIQFPDYTFFITYFQHMTILCTFTYHIYLRVGDIERAWLTKSLVPNTLIQFDSNTSLWTPGLPFTLGLPFSLPFYTITCESLCSDFSMVSHNFFLVGWLNI